MLIAASLPERTDPSQRAAAVLRKDIRKDIANCM